MSPRRLAGWAALAGCVIAARPAAAYPSLAPTAALSLDSAFDSNVQNARGADEVTRITPHLALRLADRDATLTLGYDLGAWIYARGTADNSLNHRGDVVLEARPARRLTLRLADEIIYAGDPAFLLRVGVVAPQTSIFDNTAEGQIAYEFTRRIAGSASYVYRHTTFGAPPPGSPPLFDGDEHDGALDLSARVTRLDDARIGGRVQYFTADGSGVAVDGSPAIGWRHQFLPELEGRVEGGPIFFHLLDAGQRIAATEQGAGSAVTWRAVGLLRYVRRGARASLALSRDVVGGTGAATVLWAEYAYAQGGWRNERVDLHGGVGFFANGFAPNARRLYDGVYVDAAVDVTLVGWLRLGAWYSFRWQEAVEAAAGLPLPDVTRHIVGLRISGVFGFEANPPRHPH